MKKFSSIFIFILAISSILNAQNRTALNNTCWEATISGNTQLVLELKLSKQHFSLKSHKGSNHNIIYGATYYLGRISGKINARTIEITGNQFIQNDTLFLQGQYQSLTSTQEFKGYIANNALHAVLTNNEITGRIIEKAQAIKDYKKIAQSIVDTTEQYLYNPKLILSKEWQSYKKNVLRVSEKVYDDYEFKYALNMHVRELPFTHYGIHINEAPKQMNDIASKSETTERVAEKFNIKRLNSETALFTVKTFSASAEEIIPYIDTLRSLKINNLIIDLRDNSGGTIASALPLSEFLIQDTLYGGTFLTQKYFSENKEIPSLDDLKEFPKFSEASFSKIISGIHNEKGLCLIVYPDQNNYKGKLYILTNRKTASTCEPLVYGFKTNNRATIVGERTYGGMLNGESFPITETFSLWMPTADFYTADGFKIDKVGVIPNVEVDPKLALEKTMELIGSKHSLSIK